MACAIALANGASIPIVAATGRAIGIPTLGIAATAPVNVAAILVSAASTGRLHGTAALIACGLVGLPAATRALRGRTASTLATTLAAPAAIALGMRGPGHERHCCHGRHQSSHVEHSA